jgi:toxin CcdB
VVKWRQFEVYRVIGLRSGSAVDLAIVLQDDTLSHLSTRVVAPLIPVEDDMDADRATPAVDVVDGRYIVAVHLVTTVPTRNLGNFVVTIDDRERHIKNAIDFLFFGV